MGNTDKKVEKGSSLTMNDNVSIKLLEDVPIPLLLLDREGNIVFLNKAMEGLSGYSLAEVNGASFLSTFIPERERAKEKEIQQLNDRLKVMENEIQTMLKKQADYVGVLEKQIQTLRDKIKSLEAIDQKIKEKKKEVSSP